MPANRLEKRDWTKDHVYLVQYPRCGAMPCLSPWSFKLETWLRMTNIPYTNISNNFTKVSGKGQVPFVEVNGRQIADTNFIIKELRKEFNKESFEPKTPGDQAFSRALCSLVEDQLGWCLMYFRVPHLENIASVEAWGRHLRGFKKFLFTTTLKLFSKKKWQNKLQAQGVGRHSPPEVEEITKEIFDTLSVTLGNKDYFFGDNPTTFDCYAFAFVSQFIYTNVGPEFEKYLKEATPNVFNFVGRMREKYWPDWEEIGKSLELNSWKPQ